VSRVVGFWLLVFGEGWCPTCATLLFYF
jgi:hypothetical protein